MYHKSHEYRLTGGSLYFGPVSSFVRKSQRDTSSHGVIPTYFDPDAVPPSLPVTSISSGPWEKQDRTVVVGICSDSTKKVLKAAPLISLEEAKQREATRRNRAAKRALEREIQVEREVRRFKREVAEIASWKKAQVTREEEERLARLTKEDQEKEPTLTAAVAAREDGLVVAPTNWIVPLISLDEARHTEKARRDAADKSKLPLSLSSPPPSAVASVDSLMVNAGNGSTATLRLVSLEEAAKRDRARRLEEDAIRSRTRMLAQAGTGLSHVPLITLAEARKQHALRWKNGSSQAKDKPRSPDPMSKSRKPSHPPLPSPVNRAIETGNGDRHASPKDAAAPQEKSRWIALMSNAGNWWTKPNTTSHCSDPTITRTPMGIPDWV